MRRLMGAVALGFFLQAQPLQAQPVADLYWVKVPQADASAQARDAGLNAALEQLVWRLTGSASLWNSEQLQTLRAQPQQLVRQYGVADGQLSVQFEPTLVERALQQAGVPLWGGDRPALLVWWLDEQSDGAHLLGDSQTLASTLLAAAQNNGLPVRLPLADLAEQSQITAERLADPALEEVGALAQRYAADGQLAVRVKHKEGAWQADWNLSLAGINEAGTAQSPTQENLFETVLHSVAANLAGRYAVRAGDGQSIQVRIKGINLARYAELERQLEVMPHRLLRVNGQDLFYTLKASPDQLRARLALLGLHEKDAAPSSDADQASSSSAELVFQ